MDKIKWGIVSTGMIASRFAESMRLVPDAEKTAVVSRKLERATEFAKKYGFRESYDDFTTMLNQAKPDIVYVAVPNDLHFEYVMQALEAGVHVLCEKPMADNLPQLQLMYNKAKEKNLFLMEGMWSRCFPAIRTVREWIRKGEIGRVLHVRAFFDIKPDRNNWQPWKAGIKHAAGAIRDVGIYSLAMAFIGFPEYPANVFSSHLMNGEVDEHSSLLLTYADGGSCQLSASFDRVSDHSAEIVGETGRIHIGPHFWKPSKAVLISEPSEGLPTDKSKYQFEEPYPEFGFQYEIARVQECLREGLLECPDFTRRESEDICRLIDQLRQEWGIVYASDRA
ncbi:MAG: Gfo/Idh/MocA family protein [Saccharofermentanales bacterium]